MTIRFATLEDVPVMASYWREHEQSRFAHMPFDEVRFSATMKRIIESRGAHCLLLSEDGEKRLCGVLAGKIDYYYFSSQPIAQLILYWVTPSHRSGPMALKLMMAFKKWAENRNVAELFVGVTSGEDIERTDRFLTKIGFRKTGGNYAMPLVHNPKSVDR